MNKYYRYCFKCDKWLSEKEVNEIDWGQQPGGGEGKTWNCAYCRSNLGDQIQIFKCPKHEDIILKVWGNCEGENKEKVFYEQCPKESQQEGQPDPGTIGKRALWWIGGGIIVIGGIVWLVRYFFKGGKNE